MTLEKKPGGGSGGRNAWETDHRFYTKKLHIERNNVRRTIARSDGTLLGAYFIMITDRGSGNEAWMTLDADEMVELFNAFLEMEDEYDADQ